MGRRRRRSKRHHENYRLQSSCFDIDDDLTVNITEDMPTYVAPAVLTVHRTVAAVRDLHGVYFVAITASDPAIQSRMTWIPDGSAVRFVTQANLECIARCVLHGELEPKAKTGGYRDRLKTKK